MANRILLTGAGFSANFGAPLAADMSNLIFNNPKVQQQPKLKNLLKNNYDYEDIYQKVMRTDDYSTDEKTSLNCAIKDAYNNLDERIKYDDLGQTCSNLFKELIFRFRRAS